MLVTQTSIEDHYLEFKNYNECFNEALTNSIKIYTQCRYLLITIDIKFIKK